MCAVSFDHVQEAACRLLDSQVQVVSLSPLTLSDVWDDVVRVGTAAGVRSAAEALVTERTDRLRALARRVDGQERPRVLVLEWLDPPMVAGHWTPELIRIAGGEPVLGHEGEPTGPTSWDVIVDAAPDVLLVIPCGFQLEQSLSDMAELSSRPGFADLPAVRRGAVAVIDGNAFFNRPGPRLVESAEIAAAAIHPELFPKGWETGVAGWWRRESPTTLSP